MLVRVVEEQKSEDQSYCGILRVGPLVVGKETSSEEQVSDSINYQETSTDQCVEVHWSVPVVRLVRNGQEESEMGVGLQRVISALAARPQ